MTLSYYSSTGQDPSGYIVQPLPCRNCGQSLQGLHEAHRCPGCGLPAGRSAQPGVLRFAPPAWLRTVRSGLLLEFWSIIIGITLGIIGVVAVAAWAFQQAQKGIADNLEVAMAESPLMLYVFPVLALIFNAILTYGIWLITTPEPDPGSSPYNQKFGPMARWLAVIGLAAAALVAAASMTGLFDDSVLGLTVITSIVNLIHAAAFVALVLFLAELCTQIPDRKLASRTRTTAWCGGIGLAVMAAISVLAVLAVGDSEAVMAGRPGQQGGMMAVGCFNGVVGIFVLVCYIIFLMTLSQLGGRFRQAAEYSESLLQQPLGTPPVAAQPIDPSAWTGEQEQDGIDPPQQQYPPQPPEQFPGASNWPR